MMYRVVVAEISVQKSVHPPVNIYGDDIISFEVVDHLVVGLDG
jgi:hypothetical protein